MGRNLAWTEVFGRLLRRLGVDASLKPAEAGLRQGSRVRLTPLHSVHWVEADGERLLLSCHPRGVSVLHRAPVGVQPKSSATNGRPLHEHA